MLLTCSPGVLQVRSGSQVSAHYLLLASEVERFLNQYIAQHFQELLNVLGRHRSQWRSGTCAPQVEQDFGVVNDRCQEIDPTEKEAISGPIPGRHRRLESVARLRRAAAQHASRPSRHPRRLLPAVPCVACVAFIVDTARV